MKYINTSKKLKLDLPVSARIYKYEIEPELKEPEWSWYETRISVAEKFTKFRHTLELEWFTDSISNGVAIDYEVMIMPVPPDGYEYVLNSSNKKKCAKCGKSTEFYSIAPYGSKYDGEPICAECMDK